MSKQWFLIKSLGATVDLSLVSYVIWNHVSAENLYTEICLGSSTVRKPGESENTTNEWWIKDPADRKNIQAALQALGLPTVELVFDSKQESS
jgi:hypothetical protein